MLHIEVKEKKPKKIQKTTKTQLSSKQYYQCEPQTQREFHISKFLQKKNKDSVLTLWLQTKTQDSEPREIT